MKIYTRKGDNGKTSLSLSNIAVSKSDMIFDILGTLDELNASLGFISQCKIKKIRDSIISIQSDLFVLGALIASPRTKISQEKVWYEKTSEIEKLIDYFEEKNDPLNHFILPGGCMDANYLHLSRTICRRLERLFVKYYGRRTNVASNLNKAIGCYLNRLSDLFFVMARHANKKYGIKDVIWTKK